MELVLKPEDNRRLANLCGALNQNIRQIETRLGVEIANRAYNFSIKGETRPVQAACLLLQRLYAASLKTPITGDQIHLSMQESQVNVMLEPVQSKKQNNEIQVRTKHGVIVGKGYNQKQYLRQIMANDINFGIGPAGTGKTYLAVACAVQALESDQVRRLILARPAVEAGEKLGFLPGDISQKVDPYLRPLYDALYEMLGVERVFKLIERNVIEIAPLAFMRGRTLNDAFIILDEAQNTTPEQIKMFLTRVGFGSTAVITGDLTQVDLPRGQLSGLRQVTDVLSDVEGISFTHFGKEDVVRHVLVQRIVAAYEAYEQDHPQSHF
ncbi:MAG: PhoH family protein [Methylococcales bacterium]